MGQAPPRRDHRRPLGARRPRRRGAGERHADRARPRAGRRGRGPGDRGAFERRAREKQRGRDARRDAGGAGPSGAPRWTAGSRGGLPEPGAVSQTRARCRAPHAPRECDALDRRRAALAGRSHRRARARRVQPRRHTDRDRRRGPDREGLGLRRGDGRRHVERPRAQHHVGFVQPGSRAHRDREPRWDREALGRPHRRAVHDVRPPRRGVVGGVRSRRCAGSHHGTRRRGQAMGRDDRPAPRVARRPSR